MKQGRVTTSGMAQLRDKLLLTFRGQALLFLVPLIIIMSSVYTIVSISTERKILRDEIIKKGETIATIAARNAEIPIISENQSQLKSAAASILGITDVAYVTFLNKRFEVLLHEGRQHPPGKNPGNGSDPAPRMSEQGDVFEFVVPVATVKAPEDIFLFEGGGTSSPSERIHAGWVRIGLSKAIMAKSLQAIMWRGAVLALLFSIAGIILAYYLITLATRPLQSLISAVNEIRQGEHIELPVRMQQGEIGRLTSEFNRMSRAIREREETLEQNVDELETTQEQLRDNVVELEMQIEARETAETELRKHRDHLEEMVGMRTEQLRVAKEQAEAANRAKSDFLSSMSHELRTPLNAILGYAQILRRQDNLTESQRQQMEVMHSSGEHLLMLINDILDVGKIEAEKMSVDIISFDLPSLLRQVFNLTRLQAEEKELYFEYEVNGALPQFVQGDERKLRQVLLNLLSNAVKYTRKGGVTMRVDYCQDEGKFLCEVIDSGIGIPADKLDTIFEPFTQLSSSGQGRTGTGLGLNITRRLLGLMGGALAVESELKKGSTFKLELPLPAIAGSEVALQQSASSITGYTGERKRILVVDDTIGNTAMLVALLDPLGFELDTALNGREALQRIEACEPDLVVMDLVMPEMDGLETVQQLRANHSYSDIRIIGASATVTSSANKDAFVAVCDAFVEKPIRIENLLDNIERLLGISWQTTGTGIETTAMNGSETASPGVVAVPPAERLDELYELARLGDMQRIEQWAAEIEKQDGNYAGFTRILRELATGFRTKAILAMVEQYRSEPV